MSKTLRKYNLGGPGGRVLPYSGTTKTDPDPETSGTKFNWQSAIVGIANAGMSGLSNGLAYQAQLDSMKANATKDPLNPGSYREQKAATTAAGSAAIGRPIADAGISMIPGFGKMYGAIKGVSDGIQGAYGRQWVGDADGTAKEVYGSKGDSQSEAGAKGALGNLWKPAHEHALESWTNAAETDDSGKKAEYAIAGIGDILGFTTIGRMVEGAKDSEELRMKNLLNSTSTNVGGTSGLDGRTYQRNNVLLARGGRAPQVNAELEGGEVVESPDGDEYVEGPSHAQGGVPMRLNEGDYVWSDQIEYKGKTMAEWYQAFKKNGAGEEQIEQLRQLQESLAGRHDGEPGGERMALGGYREDPGKPSKAGTFFKSTLPDWFDRTFNKGRKETSMDMQKRASAPVAAKRSDVMAENTQRSLSDEERLAQDSYLKSASQDRLRQSAQGIAPQYNPAEAYNAELTQKREQAQKPVAQDIYGQRSKFSQISEEYAPYAIAGLGAIAQLAATASTKNPYENVKMPIAQQAMNPTPVHLTRVSDTAQQAGLARDYRAGLDQMERSGAGPSSSGIAQRLLNERLQRGSEVMQRTAQMNAPIDAQEQMYNSQSLAENERFNAAQRQQNNQSRIDLQVGKRSFDANKALAIGDVFSGMTRDTLGYIGEREKTRAIYGNSGIDQRNREYSMRQAYTRLKAANPSLPDSEVWELVGKDADKQFGTGK